MRPSRGLLYAGILLGISSIISVFVPAYAPYWYLPGMACAVLAGIDALLLTRRKAPQLARRAAGIITVGRPSVVELTLSGREGRGPAKMRVFDGIPPDFDAPELPLSIIIPRDSAGREHSVEYRIIPARRGHFSFEPAWLEYPSPLGFWIRRKRVGKAQEIRVYPDYRIMMGEGLRLADSPGPQKGHLVQKRGLGLEFHQLREYRQGDMIRMVDVKASSRFNKLIVREMQEEKDQSVIFLLDTGYRMTEQEGGVSHFDQAFAAMLSLSYVALRQGDNVGIRSWGPDERWITPRRGVSAFPQIVRELYDLQAFPEASSPATILTELSQKLKRRTLIILLTNFREGDNEGLSDFLPILRTRHLVCTVWMREAVVERLAHRIPQNHDEALETAFALRFLAERERCKRAWEAAGVLTLDVVPARLSSALIEEYWKIKKRALL